MRTHMSLGCLAEDARRRRFQGPEAVVSRLEGRVWVAVEGATPRLAAGVVVGVVGSGLEGEPTVLGCACQRHSR